MRQFEFEYGRIGTRNIQGYNFIVYRSQLRTFLAVMEYTPNSNLAHAVSGVATDPGISKGLVMKMHHDIANDTGYINVYGYTLPGNKVAIALRPIAGASSGKSEFEKYNEAYKTIRDIAKRFSIPVESSAKTVLNGDQFHIAVHVPQFASAHFLDKVSQKTGVLVPYAELGEEGIGILDAAKAQELGMTANLARDGKGIKILMAPLENNISLPETASFRNAQRHMNELAEYVGIGTACRREGNLRITQNFTEQDIFIPELSFGGFLKKARSSLGCPLRIDGLLEEGVALFKPDAGTQFYNLQLTAIRDAAGYRATFRLPTAGNAEKLNKLLSSMDLSKFATAEDRFGEDRGHVDGVHRSNPETLEEVLTRVQRETPVILLGDGTSIYQK